MSEGRLVPLRPLSVPRTGEETENDFVIEPTDTVDSILQLYQAEIDKSRAIVARASLDDLSHEAVPHSLRWILIHMIEETARHAGHADILRELTDGAVGY